jgi:uncharacterized protein involved in exopolysaccharide biosynthesis
MASDNLTLVDYIAVLRRRLPLLGLTLTACLSLSVLVAFGVPAVYQSTSTILVEQQELPADVVPSTITGDAQERMEVIRQRMMSTSKLGQLIEEHQLYPELDAVDAGGMIAKVLAFQQAVLVAPISTEAVNPRSGRPSEVTIAFTVTYEHESPEVAYEVAKDLTDLFINENRRVRDEQAAQAVAFLEARAAAAQEEITAVESKIAEFKANNPGVLDDEANLVAVEQTERRLSDTRVELLRQQQRLSFLRSERTRLVEEAGGAVDRLAELQAEYARVSGLYSADHPDVIRLRKELATLTGGGTAQAFAAETELEIVQRDLAAARQRYSADHPDVLRLERRLKALESASKASKSVSVVTSPAVRQIDSDIRETSATLAALQQTQAGLEAERGAAQLRLRAAPEVQREFANMQRSLESALARSGEIQSKLGNAKLAASLETQQMAQRFSLLVEPRVPKSPTRPNRAALLLLGILLSAGVTAGVLAMTEMMDPSVRGSRDVMMALGLPPLASIPMVPTDADRERTRKHQLRYAMSVLAMVAVTGLGLGLLA